MGCPLDRALLNLASMARPTRLDCISYIGPLAYFVTSCTLERRKAFITNEFCEECRLELSATSKRFGFTTTAYCFMPDHAHILTSGNRADASLPAMVAEWKQRTGFAWRRQSGGRLCRSQAPHEGGPYERPEQCSQGTPLWGTCPL